MPRKPNLHQLFTGAVFVALFLFILSGVHA